MNYRNTDLGSTSTIAMLFAVVSGVAIAATAILPFVIAA
jgi:hypothetical protein